MIVNKKDIAALSLKDPIFEMIIDKYGNPPEWVRPQGFVSLARIIIEQQVSLDSANACYHKLSEYVGGLRPEAVICLSPEEWKACFVSRQKARYITLLAEAILANEIDLECLGSLSDEAVTTELISLKGIGPWTANVYLLFCLQRKNIFPPGDIALINTVIELKGIEKAAVNQTAADLWSPYGSLAAFTLWHYYLKERGRTIEY